jgi:hypothetical protein
VHPKHLERWRRRQQGRLLAGKRPSLLRALARKGEPQTQTEAPVPAAQRSLSERREHLDYAQARAADLPIGFGEVASGPRHVSLHRLKRAGAWGKEGHAPAMLGLRVARANQRGESYWLHQN